MKQFNKIMNDTYQGSGKASARSSGQTGNSILSGLTNLYNSGIKFIKDHTFKSRVTEFPYHQYTPEGARPFDFGRLVTVGAGTPLTDILSWTVTESFTMVITHYAIFNDAQFTDDAWFVPTINGARVLQYHGNPMDNFKISLGRTTDLGNSALMEANINLKQGQTFRWQVTNVGAVDVDMGIRMKGYFDTSNKRKAVKFG